MKNVKREKLNRQALRSRQMLQDAFKALIKEKPFKKITITDITGRADLARATFYAHFETKDDLLLSYVDDALDRFFDEMRARFSNNRPHDEDSETGFKPEMTTLFSAWKENSDALRLIRTENIDLLILRRLREYHSNLYFEHAPPETINPPLDIYLLEVISATSFALLTRWLDEGMPHSPETMSQLMQAILSGPIFGSTKARFDPMIR